MTAAAPNRVAFYARYSDDQQNDRSIEDQFRLLEEHARRQGWAEAARFEDRAISGASIRKRPGMLALLATARAGAFEIVLAEDLDRLSRDQEDTAALYKRLTRFLGIRIVTLQGGEVNTMRVAMEGFKNSDFLTNLAFKVHRGQRGSVAEGKMPGGNSYGYRIPLIYDAKGERVRGHREIDPDQAAIVRRIFAEYASGASPRTIAKRLNAEGIPGPRGRPWRDTAINGNRQRRTGLLWNALYIGKIVWNKTRALEDPENGQQIYRVKPTDEWVEQDVPELRILDQAIWDAVQARKERFAGVRAEAQRAPKRLLSGLIACGICGGSYAVIGKDRIGCSAHRTKGTCTNATTFYMSNLEERALAGLVDIVSQGRLKDHEARMRRYVGERRLAAARIRDEDDQRLAKVDKQIAGIVAAIEDGMYSAALKDRMADLERERAEIAARHDDRPLDNVIVFTPNLAETFRRQLTGLRTLLASEDSHGGRTERARDAVRALVRKIVISPGRRQAPKIEMHPDFLAAMALGSGKTASLYVSDGWGGRN